MILSLIKYQTIAAEKSTVGESCGENYLKEKHMKKSSSNCSLKSSSFCYFLFERIVVEITLVSQCSSSSCKGSITLSLKGPDMMHYRLPKKQPSRAIFLFVFHHVDNHYGQLRHLLHSVGIFNVGPI